MTTLFAQLILQKTLCILILLSLLLSRVTHPFVFYRHDALKIKNRTSKL